MSMYCHQCQETAMNKGCSKVQGVCGKTAEVANLQDLFIWTLKVYAPELMAECVAHLERTIS